MSDPVLRVLLDTSVIVGAGYGRSGPFEHLLRDSADQRVQVIVPEVVLAETGFVYRHELQHMRGALENLPRLLAAAGHRREQLRPRALQEGMERELRERLAEAGITPVPAPVSDHDELTRRIMARRKPTKALAHDGNGNELLRTERGLPRPAHLGARARRSAGRSARFRMREHTRLRRPQDRQRRTR